MVSWTSSRMGGEGEATQGLSCHVFGLGIFTSLYSYLFFCLICLRFNAPFVVLPPGSTERRWESKAWCSSERAFWMGEYLAPLGYCIFAVLYLFYCSLCLDTTSEIPIIIYPRPIRGCRPMTNYAGHITSDGCRGDTRSWPSGCSRPACASCPPAELCARGRNGHRNTCT